MSRSQNMRAMALNGLHEEFPRVTALARRIPNPKVSRAPLLWAILAAFGAALFVGAVVTVLFSLLYRLLSVPSDAWLPRPFQLSAIPTIATALPVAWVSRRRHAVAAWAAIRRVEPSVSRRGPASFWGPLHAAS